MAAACVAAVAAGSVNGAGVRGEVALREREWRRRRGGGGAGGPAAVGRRGGGPALCFLLFLTLFKSLCRELYMPLGTGVLRGFVGALGTELFAGRTVPRASSRQSLCRELPLGRACAEWKPSCAESTGCQCGSASRWWPPMNVHRRSFSSLWLSLTTTRLALVEGRPFSSPPCHGGG
jgi:hypothetical protein